MPELSQDPFAGAWIPDDQREQVRALWRDFSQAVYPHDDLVCSLRGRAVRAVLERALETDPRTSLVSIGAGFTSYPWSLPFEVALEIDLPSVVDAKRTRVAELTDRGTLPARTVHHLAVDVSGAGALDVMRAAIHDHLPADRAVAVAIEGLVYYLSPLRAIELLELPGALEVPVSAVVASYWPTGTEGHPVLTRQARWFAQRGIPNEAGHLDPQDVSAALGDGVVDQPPSELQRRFGCEPVVSDEQLIPERVAWVGT